MSVIDSMKGAVEKHPRLTGFLFATMVLMSQAGSVAASAAEVGVGP